MRVVEPSDFKKTNKPRPSKKNRYLFVLLLVVGIVGFFSLYSASDESQDTGTSTSENNQVQAETSNTEPIEDDLQPGAVRTFSGNEFKIFYDNLLQPNLDQVDVPPPISGNDIADARIRTIAEKRGYKLRSSPTVSLSSIDGFMLQKAMHQPWRELKQAATQDSIPISIVSAYRSVDDQRQLFLARLRAEGVDIADVEAGLADAEIDNVLITSSIPGYSKHHTGYTVDFLCAGFEFENFKNSPCNDWIVADNYRVAKINGFIPSYPPDADLQGPAPEAWEYVWVGSDLLVKQ